MARMIDADTLEERFADKNNGCAGECECCEHYLREKWKKGWCGLIAHAPTVATDTNVLGKWIPVKNRLPKDDREVITAYKIDDEKAMKKRKGKLFVKTGNWTGERWISVWDEYKSYATEEEVLYWMPLPEPPEEGEVG